MCRYIILGPLFLLIPTFLICFVYTTTILTTFLYISSTSSLSLNRFDSLILLNPIFTILAPPQFH